ncbi:MAG: radical SAM protein [Deltaproteobacteria bacterium]|nr:radical SAM protein [Deltaproteobacteria bacterium]
MQLLLATLRGRPVPRERRQARRRRDGTRGADFGAQEIVMFDETFGVNRKRTMAVCEDLINSGFKTSWNIRTRADLIDTTTLQALRDAGCTGIHVGIESGSQRVQKLMRKNLDLGRVRAVLGEAQKLGLATRGYFIIGYPGESRDEIRETIRYAAEAPLDWASFTICTPNPGTDIYTNAMADGRINGDYWRDYTLCASPSRPGISPATSTANQT